MYLFVSSGVHMKKEASLQGVPCYCHRRAERQRGGAMHGNVRWQCTEEPWVFILLEYDNSDPGEVGVGAFGTCSLTSESADFLPALVVFTSASGSIEQH